MVDKQGTGFSKMVVADTKPRLSEGHLISPLLCDYYTVWLIFLLIYKESQLILDTEEKQRIRFQIAITKTRIRMRNVSA